MDRVTALFSIKELKKLFHHQILKMLLSNKMKVLSVIEDKEII